jgi:hypothetical protein
MHTITYSEPLIRESGSECPLSFVEFLLPRIEDSTRAIADFHLLQMAQVLASSASENNRVAEFRQDQIDAMNAFGAATERDAFE